MKFLSRLMIAIAILMPLVIYMQFSILESMARDKYRFYVGIADEVQVKVFDGYSINVYPDRSERNYVGLRLSTTGVAYDSLFNAIKQNNSSLRQRWLKVPLSKKHWLLWPYKRTYKVNALKYGYIKASYRLESNYKYIGLTQYISDLKYALRNEREESGSR